MVRHGPFMANVFFFLLGELQMREVGRSLLIYRVAWRYPLHGSVAIFAILAITLHCMGIIAHTIGANRDSNLGYNFRIYLIYTLL